VKVLDEQRAAALEALCELIVPGSARVGPVVYIDALLARMPEPVRGHALEAIDALTPPTEETLAEKERAPEFAFVRSLAIEAYYSDFVAPGRNAEGAWAEIGFDPPAALRLRKDWSYLGVA
jgi:long-chain-alcohol oxidase